MGEHTLIDEALEGAGEDIGRFNDRQSEKLLEKLHRAKTPDVAPFKQSVMEVDTLYNRPTQIAVDAENVYILPAKRQSSDTRQATRHADGQRRLSPLRLQPQLQVAQLGALAGKARLSSLAHPPPLADLLGVRAHVIVPLHHLLEQLGGHAHVG